jgi:endonuclease/exonuclease/phosphatase family metal-dependent hydrolase
MIRIALVALLCAVACRGAPTADRERTEPERPPIRAAQDAGPARPPAVSPKAADALLPEGSVWRSPRACERALATGQRAARSAGVARIGTWNVRWYPDGRPGRRASGAGGTDVAWLACLIAWLNVDALAVQEFKAHARAREKSAELVRALDRHTAGRWRLELDDCRGGDAGQHVGILYDARRVAASEPLVLASLNPHGKPCKDQLRPGLGMRLRFVGGLDLYLVSVHLKSGSERRSFELRKRSLEGLVAAVDDLQVLGSDSDLVFAGDFNSMGCRRCSPPIGAAEELAASDELLAGLRIPFRRIEASAPCTAYYRGGTGQLDHFVVSSSLRELGPRARASVSGFCGETACSRLPKRSEPSVQAAISDHCPLVLELTDRDLD